jgi:hypothetical protein
MRLEAKNRRASVDGRWPAYIFFSSSDIHSNLSVPKDILFCVEFKFPAILCDSVTTSRRKWDD